MLKKGYKYDSKCITTHMIPQGNHDFMYFNFFL